LTKQYKGGYDRQSVLSAAGKPSCNKTALKRCTRTEYFEIVINIQVVRKIQIDRKDGQIRVENKIPRDDS